MQLLKDIPAKELIQGITGHYAHGNNMSFGLVEITAGTVMPVHQHVHEQITFLLEGHLDMEIDGVVYSLTPGCYHVIPSNAWHGAYAVTACKLIDVFAPIREEYKTI
jgi:quercetin dioxygenase-like cupin family protein